MSRKWIERDEPIRTRYLLASVEALTEHACLTLMYLPT